MHWVKHCGNHMPGVIELAHSGMSQVFKNSSDFCVFCKLVLCFSPEPEQLECPFKLGQVQLGHGYDMEWRGTSKNGNNMSKKGNHMFFTVI